MLVIMRILVGAIFFATVCLLPSCSERAEFDTAEESTTAEPGSNDTGEGAGTGANARAETAPPAEEPPNSGAGPEVNLESNKAAQDALAKALAGGQTNTSGKNPFAAPPKQEELPSLQSLIDQDPGAVAHPSGIHYSVITETEGPKPDKYARVTVHYKGTRTDGSVFDSTYKRRNPLGFKLNQCRPEGLKQGIQLLSAGAKYKLYVPSRLGFGERGVGSKIGANVDLVYEIELLEFEPGPKLPEFKQGNPEAQKTTEEGLIYEVLKEGTGPAPEMGTLVEIDFAFWTLDGELVDASAIRGAPWKINVGKAREKIFNLGTLLLKEGGRNRYVVPPELGFGKRGRGALVPPDTTLVFEIELTKVWAPLPIPEFSLPQNTQLQETKSGLMYQVIKEGEGEPPSVNDTVSVHYAGWLEDGTCFDNSFQRGIPSTFPLSRVITGWTEGLKLMKPGAVYKFSIPPDLAYGDRGQPPRIPGDATLIFHIELLEVKK